MAQGGLAVSSRPTASVGRFLVRPTGRLSAPIGKHWPTCSGLMCRVPASVARCLSGRLEPLHGRTYRGKGLGGMLLIDALRRSLTASRTKGLRGGDCRRQRRYDGGVFRTGAPPRSPDEERSSNLVAWVAGDANESRLGASQPIRIAMVGGVDALGCTGSLGRARGAIYATRPATSCWQALC
jgi:hypothetical protein